MGVGAFISKLLGAFYRVPLTNALGSVGLGLYQMVFPVYCLLLDFSGAGVPNALAKLIATGGEEQRQLRAENYLKNSLILLLILGVIGSLLMAIFSMPLANLQGNYQAKTAYIALSPAVLLVCLISCFRGYFQGLMDMKPTAFSQVIEQIVKLGFGLAMVKVFSGQIEKAVAGATFAISISETVALTYLIFVYKSRKKNYSNIILPKNEGFSFYAKNIIKTTFPLTIIGVAIPFSQVIDSFLTINLIGGYNSNATALYGLFSGAVITVINLPVSICYGISAVAIPAVSSAKTEREKDFKAEKTLLLTVVASLPCVIFCLAFAPFIVNILFGSLIETEKNIVIKLLRLTSPCILLLSVVQTSNAVLVGRGKTYFPVLSLSLGIALKTILSLILLKIPKVNIYGSSIALIACYFSVCLVNLILILKTRVKNANTPTYNRQYAS